MLRLLVFVLALVVSTTLASASLWDDCESNDANRIIKGCTQIIKKGKRETRKNRAIAYNNRGNAYQNKGQTDRAIADYDKAIKLDPKDADAYNNRAWAYFKWGKASRGLPDANRALELDPKAAYAYDTRGHIYEALDRKDKAIADFRKALELNPSLKESMDGLKRLGVEPEKTNSATQKKTGGKVETAKAGGSREADLVFWNSVKDSGDPDMFQAYLDQFPKGTFATLARIKLEKLKKAP